MMSTESRSGAVQYLEEAQVMLLKAAFALGRAYIDLREIGEEDDNINAMLDVIRVTELALDAKRKQLKEAKNERLLHTGRGNEDREAAADGL